MIFSSVEKNSGKNGPLTLTMVIVTIIFEAFPILKKYDFKATVFLITSRIRNAWIPELAAD